MNGVGFKQDTWYIYMQFSKDISTLGVKEEKSVPSLSESHFFFRNELSPG